VAAVLEIKTTGWETVTMVVRGELDMRQAPALRAAITALLNRGDLTAIDLDLSDVAFIDSTGLGTIVVGHRIAADLGVTLQVTASSLFAARLLSLVGADLAGTARVRRAGAGPDDPLRRVPAMVRSRFVITPGAAGWTRWRTADPVTLLQRAERDAAGADKHTARALDAYTPRHEPGGVQQQKIMGYSCWVGPGWMASRSAPSSGRRMAVVGE
jgi:anti-anti-sigma factor